MRELLSTKSEYAKRGGTKWLLKSAYGISYLKVHSTDFFSNNRERSERTLKIGGEIPSKRNILYDIIMRRDLEKVDVALLQSSFE